ncbi:alpha-L-fucosidase [candidate division KSB1 bacterium]|nr:alpha-L-fucosidase [candidate division KSB1 bacterium]
MNLNTCCIVILCSSIVMAFSCSHRPADIPPNEVVSTEQQIAYQRMELIGFVHFTVNTFTDREWGYGDESPDVFNPTVLNTRQWAATAKDVGMKQLILTAKHHDGFCLWPSDHTDHSVKNSPWKNGQGDVVREFVDACHEYGLRVGLYLSPWDRNHAEYGRDNYIRYYRDQLTELLTRYGEISEIWFDGANGGTGYYGGAREERRIDRKTYYHWDETFKLVKRLQPDLLIFSDSGPDIRWIGNEHGHAGETNWSMLSVDKTVIGEADVDYLNSGDPEGTTWVVGECDVSVRPGWFYHEREDTLVKTPQQLVDIYYKSVGRNGVLLLNIPPDRRGLFHENDISALKKFHEILEETFDVNLAQGKVARASNSRLNHKKFSPQNILDDDADSYWATDDSVRQATIEIDLGDRVQFDRIMIQEPIRFGQRISKFSVEGRVDHEWLTLTRGTTIGYKRLLRIKPVQTDRVRLIIMESNNTPAISNFGLYKASADEGVGQD